MNIPKIKTYYITLRATDGSDIVTEQPVKFAGEPSYFITANGMGFKKIWESQVSATYSQVSCSSLDSIVVTNNG